MTDRADHVASRMKQILVREVVAVEDSITALRNRERNEGSDLSDEITQKKARLAALREEYAALANELITLDSRRAGAVIAENKTLLKQLAENRVQDLKDAREGTWWDE